MLIHSVEATAGVLANADSVLRSCAFSAGGTGQLSNPKKVPTGIQCWFSYMASLMLSSYVKALTDNMTHRHT